ncbi:MAG: NAD(P)H-hydrate epimerase, partial [Spirochaetaceae bacterium]
MSLPGAYRTEDGVILPAVTTEEMRELDAIATEETGPNLFQMMENAGRNLAGVVLEELQGSDASPSVVVLAGTGCNGGGGICAARHLANRGLDVTLCVSHPDRLSGVPAEQRATYGHSSGAVVDAAYLASLEAEIIIDALIGYSLADAPRSEVHDMIAWAVDQRARFGARIVSLDLPSGIDGSTGEAPGAHICADTTLALGLPKSGLHPRGEISPVCAGRLRLGDIGVPSGLYARFGSPA